jgi:hypothetical protein
VTATPTSTLPTTRCELHETTVTETLDVAPRGGPIRTANRMEWELTARTSTATATPTSSSPTLPKNQRALHEPRRRR